MKSSKKFRFIPLVVAILFGGLFFSPFLKYLNPVAPVRVAAAAQSVDNTSNLQHLPWLAMTPQGTVTETSTPIMTSTILNSSAVRKPTATSTPMPPMPSLYGVNMDHLNSAGGLDQMAAANIVWARTTGVQWSSIESASGIYDWSVLTSLETELENASNKGIQVILVVNSTPEWARKDGGTGPWCGPIAKNKLSVFGDFMHELVLRLSVAPYNVKYWEMWNEEDISSTFFTGDNGYGCWGDSHDAYFGGAYYAKMLKAIYPTIKAADPQAQVLIGGLLLDCDPRRKAGCAMVGHDPKPAKFLEGILKKIHGRYFDGISFHAYDYYNLDVSGQGYYYNPNWQSAWNTTGPVINAKTQFIQKLLKKYSVTGKYLLNTETALLCGATGTEAACQTDMFSNIKTYYVAQSYSMAIAQGLRASLWYSALGWRGSGLLNKDLTPKPAYTAFGFSESELMDAAFVGNITSSDTGGVSGTKGYKFLRNGHSVWAVWSLDGSPHLISFSQGSLSAAWDALGNSISVDTSTSSISIPLEPLYLEWNY